MAEALWYLKHCELLQGLTTAQIQRLESCSRMRSFGAKNPVYLPAEAATSVFVLAKGLVKVCHLTPDGKESILAFIEPGEMFGERALFDNAERDEYVEAVESSLVVMIPVSELRQLIIERADIALGLTTMVGLRRHRIERRLKNLLFLSNRERLVHLLIELAEQFGVAANEGVRLRIKLSHQELANLIGSTRETVTVTLGQLKAEHLVTGGRQKITVTNPEGLAACVGRKWTGSHRPQLQFSSAVFAPQ